jgi:hypothetical protein
MRSAHRVSQQQEADSAEAKKQVRRHTRHQEASSIQYVGGFKTLSTQVGFPTVAVKTKPTAVLQFSQQTNGTVRIEGAIQLVLEQTLKIGGRKPPSKATLKKTAKPLGF